MASIPEGFEVVDNDIPEGFEAVDTGFPGASFIEPALAVASGIPASIASGVTGLVAGAVGGSEAAASVQADVQKDLTFEPKTQAGKEGLQTLGDIVKFGGDVLNVPLSGIAGLVELVSSGFDVDKAAETVRSTQKQGIKKELGEQAFEATEGAPVPVRAAVATLAELIPDIALTATGLKGAKVTGQASKELAAQAKQAGTLTVQELAPIAKAGGELIKDIKRFQTPKTREIARQLKAGDINTDVALLKLADEGISNPTVRQKLLGADLPKVVKDTPTVQAARQGISEDFLEVVKKGSTRADKSALIKMTDIAKKGRTNPLFRRDSRPSFVAGDVLLDKVNAIKSINRAAGKRIGNATKFLKGKQVPVAEIGDKFLSTLDDLKITIKPDGKLDFKDALISGAGRKKAIADIFDRMSRNKNPDALDLHELKQFIDDTVSYGKTVRGLGGKAENALKGLRTNIKETLDSNFPQYAKANEAYSDTIGLLDKIQDLAGKKTNLTSDSAAGDLATLARRITSNAQSRGRVRDAFLDLDKLLDKHAGFSGVKRLPGKGDGKVDFNLLMEYADELDKVTGSAATTSFAGAGETALKAVLGPKQFLADKATEAAKGLAGVSVKRAHETMSEFLKSELKAQK
ncbi:MAG: hypothetical protein COB12_11960 [Flavobacterium sp.]|nr:MAG: hypothetical protein COB12_11960 [Flavobacterium sp.]